MGGRIKREFPGVSAYFDRHRKRRYRYRSKGFSSEIHGGYGSVEFRNNYEAALAGQRSINIGSGKTLRGSISALIVSYYSSPQFISLKNSTKQPYRREIERLRNDHGHRLVAQMRRAHVVKILQPLSDRPSARNNRLRMLRMLLNHALEIDWIESNPTTGIKKMRSIGGGFHTWSNSEIETFLAFHEKGTVAHTAITLMLHTACARADAVRLGWQNVKSSRLKYRRQKTEGYDSVLIDIPVHPALEEILVGLSKTKLTFLETSNGSARSPNGLGNLVRKWCDEAGLPQCTSHGLRKACATRLAEAGATEREIMAWTGHKSPQMVQVYAGKARRGVLADNGFQKLVENETGSIVDEPKVKGSAK